MTKKSNSEKSEDLVPTESEMEEALFRSGYLLEGRLIKMLDKMGFFVEPNSAYLDKKTGVSREVDIVAESAHYNQHRTNTRVKTVFVIEAINNLFPVALMTNGTFNPNLDTQNCIPHSCTPSFDINNHPFYSELYLLEEKSLLKNEWFCQYCAFSRKKNGGALFASHSDDLHGSINKAVEHCLSLRSFAMGWMKNTRTHDFWRIFQWRPLIVLRDDLYKFEGKHLERVHSAKLLYNLHYESKPESIIVDFVSEQGMPDFVNQVLSEDDLIEGKLFSLKDSRV